MSIQTQQETRYQVDDIAFKSAFVNGGRMANADSQQGDRSRSDNRVL
jgi:hypothetical protein